MNKLRVNELKAALKENIIGKVPIIYEAFDCGNYLNLMEKEKSDENTKMYDNEKSVQIYRNF